MLYSKSDDNEVVVAVPVAADPPLANTIEYEAIPKLLFVDMQQEDGEKVAAAFTTLTDLLHPLNANWKVNADQAFSSGAIAVIVLLMRKWHYNRSIQVHGCSVLCWLTYYDDGEKDASEADAKAARARVTAAAVSIIKSGGIETIMAAMKSFPDDDNIPVGFAIGNAFFLSVSPIYDINYGHPQYRFREYVTNPTIDKAMARFVHNLNGIELVVSVMKKFQNNASVQESGCHVLWQLSRKQVLRDALKKRGALSAVGEANEKHDDNSIQSKANAFLKTRLMTKTLPTHLVIRYRFQFPNIDNDGSV